MKRSLPASLFALLLCLACPAARAAEAPLPIRVLVVTTFEVGRDTGDQAGEFQRWVEGLPLAEVVPFPGGYHDLRLNRSLDVLGIVTGEGPARAAASIEAIGNDPRFDLSHAYVLLAGIGGIDPRVGSPGSAAWARFVVDGGLAHQIDAREIPPGWSTGFVPLQRATPYAMPVPEARSITGTGVFTLNAGLVDWAFGLTRHLTLEDSPALRANRARYTDQAQARTMPAVLEGDVVASPTFWIGARMNRWAEDWVAYWTHGQGRFATTAEEDAGFMEAMTFLSQVHKVDLARVLVLRTASNFDMPPPGQTPAQLLAEEAGPQSFSALNQAVDAAYAMGGTVVRELATHWDRYRDEVPGDRSGH